MRTTRARTVLSLVGALLVSATTVAGTSAPASAGTTLCDPNHVWYSTTGGYTYTLTHVKGYQVPPGGQTTITKSASWTRTLSASFSVSTGASVSGSGIVASAEASMNTNLAVDGSRTTTNAVSVESVLAGSSSDRFYASYQGRRYYTGAWSKKRCNSTGSAVSVLAKGSWTNYSTVELEGHALCPYTRYASGSLPSKACLATWN